MGGAAEGLAEAGCAECVQAMGQAREAQLEAAGAVQSLCAALARPEPPRGVSSGPADAEERCYLVPKNLAKRAPKLAAEGN